MVAVYDCGFVDEAHAERAVKGTFAHVDYAVVAKNRDYSCSDHMLMWGNVYDDDEGNVDAVAEDVVDAVADEPHHCCHRRRRRHRRYCCHWCRRRRHANAAVVFVDRDVVCGDWADSLTD